MSFLERFRAQSRWSLRCEALVLFFLTAWADYATGYEISLFVVYCLPILLVVWFGDKSFGLVLSLVGAVLWLVADILSGHPYTAIWIAIWNTVVQLLFLLFVAIGGAALKFQLDERSAQVERLERIRQLELEILRISEREQERIGQDLHDGLCQFLAAIGCAAASLKGDLRARGVPEADAAEELVGLLRESVVQARNSARGLFPVKDDEAGLESALNELAATASRLMNIECVFDCEEHVPIFDSAAANHLFRIAQESLNNAVKHGKARRVKIFLRAANDQIVLSVSDNGIGFVPPFPENGGMGLRIMDYRARTMGASWKIERSEPGGTVVTCSLPQKVASNS